MSNIIFSLASGLILGVHYGGRFGLLPSPTLYLNIILFLVCCFWFLRETRERNSARYFAPDLGADDVMSMLYAIAVVAAWLKGYVPQTASGLKMIAVLNIVAAVLSYLVWVWRLQYGKEREREDWEAKFKQKHQIKA